MILLNHWNAKYFAINIRFASISCLFDRFLLQHWNMIFSIRISSRLSANVESHPVNLHINEWPSAIDICLLHLDSRQYAGWHFCFGEIEVWPEISWTDNPEGMMKRWGTCICLTEGKEWYWMALRLIGGLKIWGDRTGFPNVCFQLLSVNDL